MTSENMKAELEKYRKELEGLNAKLAQMEEQKQQILKVGTRLEGVVAYLKKKIAEEEELESVKLPEPSSK